MTDFVSFRNVAVVKFDGGLVVGRIVLVGRVEEGHQVLFVHLHLNDGDPVEDMIETERK